MPTFLDNFRPFLNENLCTQVPTWPSSLLPHNVNQRSKELRWLVRVGMFSENDCLLKNVLAVWCVKIILWRHRHYVSQMTSPKQRHNFFSFWAPPIKISGYANASKVSQKLELQLQAIAARDIARGFLDHSYQSHLSNLGTTNCHFKIVRCECVFNVKFKSFISLL